MPIDVFNLVHGRETSKSSHEVSCTRDDQSCSPLPHIKNKESSLLFLVNSSAEISLVKPLPNKRRNPQASNALVTVNGAHIVTYYVLR